MKIVQKMKNFLNLVENMLAGEHHCISCKREIKDGSRFQLCKNCEDNLDLICGNICTKCGESLLDGNMLCVVCKDNDYNFNSNRSFCYYSEVSSNIIKALKYDSRKYYSKYIAKMMTADLSVFKDVDYLTFVPITKNRRRLRGFNQAEEIAKEISKIVGIEVVEFLSKTIDHKNQARLNQKERLENLKDTFELDLDNEDKIKGKTVMIIDDVFTTGATLSECSKIIKTKNPKVVLTYTFAKTKMNSLN